MANTGWAFCRRCWRPVPGCRWSLCSGVGAESELAGLARDKGAFTLVSKVDSLDVLWAEIQRALPALEKDSAAAAAATKPARAAARR